MFRLGLVLALRGGREALVRLLVTMSAVAIGVTLLLAVLADFHAFQTTSNRPSWESTTAMPDNATDTSNTALWNYSENIYKGQFIEQLDVASLGTNAPVIPGLSRLPGAGQYYASPALAALLRTVPHDELGARFSGSQVGTIGRQALSSPSELVIVIGHSPSELTARPNTIRVNKIATNPQLQGTTNIYRLVFGVAAMAVLFPLLILINTATRLSASRREERYAAMRLIGATPSQINSIASADAIIGALFGAIVGIAIFLLAQPSIANISFSGTKFFASSVTPTVWGYIGMLVVVPIAAAIGSLVSLHRVRISPLGASHKVTPPAPKAWRILPLLIGVPLFVIPLASPSNLTNAGNSAANILPVFLGLLLIMIGLIVSGSWLTMQAARLLSRFSPGPAPLLAARRLIDNPKSAFRSVSGLVLAVFVGSVIAMVVPIEINTQSSGSIGQLTNVLRVSYATHPDAPGLTPQASASLIHKLESYSGVNVLPIYSNPAFVALAQAQNTSKQPAPGGPMDANMPPANILECSSLSTWSVVGSCAPRLKAVQAEVVGELFTDNPLDISKNLPIVTSTHGKPVSFDASTANLAGMLIRTNGGSTLEKVRTFLTTYNATLSSAGSANLTSWQMGNIEPETFGETAQIRGNDDKNIERVVFAILVLTILIAGCSLAVTVGGGIIERKRAFTLLRLSGAPISILYKVVLLESILPLLAAALIAAVTGIGVAIPLTRTFVPPHTPITFPGSTYYLTMGMGLGISILVILLTLPLLTIVTKPENARFE